MQFTFQRKLEYSEPTMAATSFSLSLPNSRTRTETGTHADRSVSNKVPQIAIAFWIIKIAATTLGETGGDALSMTLNLGYLLSTGIFMACFLVALAFQMRAKAFHSYLYWTVIVATTTVGTTMADFADRSLGVGYVGGSLILFALLMMVLVVWRYSVGSVSFSEIKSTKVEIFYWVTILFSNTLGTALGDFLADTSGVGYERGAMIFSVALVVIAALYFFTDISRTFLFWSAFILTRPLGATLGDLLTKPHEHGGLNLSRISSSLAIAVFMIACILMTGNKAGEHPAER